MTDEFEEKLRRALRPRKPGDDFADRIISGLGAGDLDQSSVSRLGPRLERGIRRGYRSAWLPAAIAACLIACVGLVQLRKHALDAARATQARAQLLQALSIASDNVNIVRSTVAREENPDS